MTATESDLDRIEGSGTGTSTLLDPADRDRDALSARAEIAIRVRRRIAVSVWLLALLGWTLWRGVAFDRTQLLLIICSGLIAAGVGRRRPLAVVRDWLPFAAVLFIYDLSRGAATLVGRPTQWQLQVRVDRWLFFGNEPTVWLQEHLKQAAAPWWEVGVSAVYVSFFIVPYAVAGVLWLRNRDDWRRYVLRFLTIAFVGLACFVAFPAAPPWAASVCTAAQVADGPSDPACMDAPSGSAADGGLLGPVTARHAGAASYVERISNRGWDRLGLTEAKAMVDEGQAAVNKVAAVPSLHAAISSLVTVFLWPRVRRRWRPVLAGYALAMAFALVYSAEHYVFDILLGWLLTAVVSVAFGRWDARRATGSWRRAAAPENPAPDPDTLDGPLLTRS